MTSRDKKQRENRMAAFIRQYGRKEAPHDPNDRDYDREFAKLIKQLSPEEVDRLMHGDKDEE